jgi:tetratricopeptide (TPR) repeat protein
MSQEEKMRRVLVVIVVFCAICGCSKKKPSHNPDLCSRPASIMDVAPEKMPEALHSLYRLEPDRRFMVAAVEIDRLLGGKEIPAIRACFGNGKWHLYCEGEEVGALPEFPGFADMAGWLEQWTKARMEENDFEWGDRSLDASFRNEMQRGRDHFLDTGIFPILKKLDDRWARGDNPSEAVAWARRLYTLLSLQSLDSVETGDELTSRTIALLTLSKAAKTGDTARDEALLAYLTGYSHHAATMAAMLPGSDPVRLFVCRDQEKLKAAAETPGSPRLTRYLYLSSLAGKKEGRLWLEGRFRLFPDCAGEPSILKSGLAGANFGLNESLPLQVMGQLMRRMAPGEVKAVDNLQEMNFDRFEAGVAERTLGYTGPFLERNLAVRYYNGYLNSCLDTAFRFQLDQFGSEESARGFLTGLRKTKSETVSCFISWAGHLVDLREGKGGMPQVVADVETPSSLGLPARLRSMKELTERWDWSDPRLSVSIRKLAWRMDSRPDHREALSTLAFSFLYDLPMYRRLMVSLDRDAPELYPHAHVVVSAFRNDLEALRRAAQDTELDAWYRFNAADKLAQRGEPDAEVETLYEAIVQAGDLRWSEIERFVEFQEMKARPDKAQKAVLDWLGSHGPDDGFDYIHAKRKLALLLLKEGRSGEALKVIREVAGSWQAGALESNALILDKLNRRAEAIEVMQMVIGRYPTLIRSRALLARFFWEAGRFDEAATIILQAPNPPTQFDWNGEISPAFAEAFRGKGKPAMAAAIEALRRNGGSDWNLFQMAEHFRENGDEATSFEIGSGLQGDLVQSLIFRIGSFRSLSQWKGREAALAWIREQVPLQQRNLAAYFAYEEDEYDLVWDLIGEPPPGNDEETENGWLFKACVWLKTGAKKDARYAALEKALRIPGKTKYSVMARYLLGMAPEAQLFTFRDTPKSRGEISYYIALKAMADGRPEDASDWFRICKETGFSMNGEYRFASHELDRIIRSFMGTPLSK